MTLVLVIINFVVIMSPLLDNFRLNTVFIVSLQRKVTKQIQGKILAN